MEGWAWLLGYVAVFALLQVVLYRYLRDRDGSRVTGTTPPGQPRRGAGDDADDPYVDDPFADANVDGPFADANVDDPTPEEGLVRCPHCGGPNQAVSTFTYCRNCLRPLGT